MTEEQIAEAGRAAYRDAKHPPMPDELVAKVGALLAPAGQPEPFVKGGVKPNVHSGEAAA